MGLAYFLYNYIQLQLRSYMTPNIEKGLSSEAEALPMRMVLLCGGNN